MKMHKRKNNIHKSIERLNLDEITYAETLTLAGGWSHEKTIFLCVLGFVAASGLIFFEVRNKCISNFLGHRNTNNPIKGSNHSF